MICDAPKVPGGVARLEAIIEPPAITVFFISASAIEAGLKTALIELLEDQGHETLLVADLDAAQRDAAGRSIHSREEQPTAVVAIDLLPMEQDGQFPCFDNPKIPKALERARRLGDAGFDPLSATSNSRDAWRMVELLFGDKAAKLRAKARRMQANFLTGPAIRDLTREGRRAKVELIEFNDALAIRKTYRPSALRYMEREIEVLQQLSPIRPELPKLLHRGPNCIVITCIEGGRDLCLEHRGGPPTPLPLNIVRALAGFIKACVDQGFDPIDLRAPGNVMLTDRGLKVIDFELWRRCAPGTRPEQSLCLNGVPASDTERPRGVPSFAKPYATGWYPLTLLSLESFLYDPPWLQHMKRGANFLGIWTSRGARKLGRRLRARSLPAPRRNPRYIPADLGVDGVIAELNRRNVRYAVLRWFEGLPELPAGGDLDLLVHDDDIAEADRVLDAKDGIAECDVFSVGGLPGTMYSGFPHLPPEMASKILKSARLFNGMYRAPMTEDYFLSLAFHSVYHKGFKTGLPSRHPAPADIPKPKNDYRGTLARLADELGLDVEISLEDLHDYLVAKGWNAPPEMLKALSGRNAWIGAHLKI